MIYVSEWRRYLSRNCRPNQRMFVLDQGPIYALGRLEAMGKPFLRSAVYRRWRQRMTEAWAEDLSRIIVLDAPTGSWSNESRVVARLMKRRENLRKSDTNSLPDTAVPSTR